MDRSTENLSVKKKGIIAFLLIVSCLLSGYLFWTTEPQPVYRLTSPSQLDTLITDSFSKFNFSNAQIRTQHVQIDSTFIRKRYIVEVEPGFSKTSFHYNLHQRVWPYHAETIGNVYFPDRDLQIHIAYNGTIHRTVYLYSETGN